MSGDGHSPWRFGARCGMEGRRERVSIEPSPPAFRAVYFQIKSEEKQGRVTARFLGGEELQGFRGSGSGGKHKRCDGFIFTRLHLLANEQTHHKNQREVNGLVIQGLVIQGSSRAPCS